MALSLYSSRLVLNILGIDDYGIYSLVAGIVSMLSFLTNSLVGSTQRFLSVSQGKGNNELVKSVFGNSLLLHVFLGLIVTIILEISTPLLFDSFLNIPEERMSVAKVLYQQVVWMVYISFVASPFRALLVSRENIVYTSIVDVLDGILKVILVLALPLISIDKLLAYGWIMFGIQVFNLIAFLVYCFAKYDECVLPKYKHFSWSYIKNLLSYTGWVVYSTLVITGRNQGIALVINKFYSVAVNAAYGIGNQLASMFAFVSTSFTNAISPQLMAAEGAGNRGKMWQLAEVQSKFSFLLLAMLAVPTIFEMKRLLSIWLGEVPTYAVLFASMFLTMQTIDQLSQGLGLANRAIGNIGIYTLVTYTPKLFVLPISWYLLHNEYSIVTIVILMITIEYLCMLLRIYLFVGQSDFSIKDYCKNVLIKTCYPVLLSVLVCYMITHFYSSPFRFIITYVISVLVFVISAYSFSLNCNERYKIISIAQKFIR